MISHLLKDITEDEWSTMKDGIRNFYIMGLDGIEALIRLDLRGRRGRVRHAHFDIPEDDWRIAPKANEQLREFYFAYWRVYRNQRPKKLWRAPGSLTVVQISFLKEHTGEWLYRVAQFLSDPRNLYYSIFDLDPSSRHFYLYIRRRWLSERKKRLVPGGPDVA